MKSNSKKIINLTIFIVTAGIVVGYSLFETRNIWHGPQISVESPQNGSTVTEEIIDLKGVATNAQSIFIDDRPIFIDSTGNFTEKLILAKGYNTISIQARDRFGSEIEKVLEFVLLEN